MTKHWNARRGSVMTLCVVVSAVMCGLICAMSWVASNQSQSVRGLAQEDQAFYAAESGAERIAWYARNHQIGTIRSPITGTVNGYTYTVTWPQGTNSKAILTSVASNGTASYSMTMNAVPIASPVPAFSTAGNFDNKNITVTGNIAT